MDITTTSFAGTSQIGTPTVVKRNSAPLPPTNPITRNSFSLLTKKEVGFKSFIYRDISPSFATHPITGDIAFITDFDAVSQSIKNILMTEKNERHFDQLNFGVGIERYLFTNYDRNVAESITEDIIAQVSAFEPRAVLYDVKVIGYPESNALEVQIKYGIKTLPTTETFTLFIERA